MRLEALDKAREDPRGTPARILDAAEDVFAEQGYGAASTREMARRAGVPFGALARFGIGVIRDTMPDVQIDVPAAIFVIANAFIASLADVDGQEDLLGGSVYTSRPARERLRAELKRFAYLVFNVTD